MDEFWLRIESLPLATHIAETWWFPLLESLHVVGIVVLLGAILMVDLRLLNVAAARYSRESMIRELTPWAWGGFVLAILTGVGLFVTRASFYVENVAFLWKLALLVGAGVNVAWLHARVLRSSDGVAAFRWAGGLSLLLWCLVVLAGRWIGHLS